MLFEIKNENPQFHKFIFKNYSLIMELLANKESKLDWTKFNIEMSSQEFVKNCLKEELIENDQEYIFEKPSKFPLGKIFTGAMGSAV